ncbi:MAG: response regulator [Ignavibacteriales bacterium]
MVIQILLVDDDDNFRARIRFYLGKVLQNCDFKEAVNGYEALQLVNEKRFDLIISDFDMPIMGGEEFTYKVRKWLHLETPIILVTDLFFEQEYSSMGFSSFVHKSDIHESLLNQVRKFI